MIRTVGEGASPPGKVERVSTGVAGLDQMLHGGLLPGRPYLLSGDAGSGKTTLALQFLLEGVRRGERVLLVAVDEPPHEIMENARTFGWDLSRVMTLDANPGIETFHRNGDVREIKSMHAAVSMDRLSEAVHTSQAHGDVSVQTIYFLLKQQLEAFPVQRLVVDSLTSIREFAIRQTGDPQAARTEIQSLLRFFSERGFTTLLTAQPSTSSFLSPEEILCRGEIALHRGWVGDSTEWTAQVVRLRGSDHELQSRSVMIGKMGLQVEVPGVPMLPFEEELPFAGAETPLELPPGRSSVPEGNVRGFPQAITAATGTSHVPGAFR